MHLIKCLGHVARAVVLWRGYCWTGLQLLWRNGVFVSMQDFNFVSTVWGLCSRVVNLHLPLGRLIPTPEGCGVTRHARTLELSASAAFTCLGPTTPGTGLFAK